MCNVAELATIGECNYMCVRARVCVCVCVYVCMYVCMYV